MERVCCLLSNDASFVLLVLIRWWRNAVDICSRVIIIWERIWVRYTDMPRSAHKLSPAVGHDH